VALVNGTKHTQKKSSLTERTDKALFSGLL